MLIVATVGKVRMANSKHNCEHDDNGEDCDQGDPEFHVLPEVLLSHFATRSTERRGLKKPTITSEIDNVTQYLGYYIQEKMQYFHSIFYTSLKCLRLRVLFEYVRMVPQK